MYPVSASTCEMEMGNPFGSLFLDSFCMMVRLGLARPHVQPCPRKTVSSFRFLVSGFSGS